MPIYRRVTGFCEKCYDTAHAKITNSHSKPRGASTSDDLARSACRDTHVATAIHGITIVVSPGM